MRASQRFRNGLRALIQQYGTQGMKQRQWDHEYLHGRWDCLHRSDWMAGYIYPYLLRWAEGGDILDLGCGPGTTGTHLPMGTYRRYVGVDISPVAIERARQRTIETCREAFNYYECADIFRYEPKETFDVILFGDSLYYRPRTMRIRELFDRLRGSLKPTGVFIIKTKDTEDAFGSFLSEVACSGHLISRTCHGSARVWILVLR
jgi:SAM-dependent methyltransferase